ncbi:hypothetical protein [Kitasatospora sp. NBC_00315]|uniref:hypothetical protein n=1 Tax=Kitasatospora sp. NBC_00315 TaxID=2975963 RepID=UPI0032444DE8
MPEAMAVQAVRLLGPRAEASAAAILAEHPGLGPAQHRERATARGVRASVLEGAFLGGPFMLLWPAAFVAALSAQIRMVLELAALSGVHREPGELAADLLVLQGVCSSPEAARELLDAAGPADEESADQASADEAPADGEPAGRTGWWVLVKRLAYLIGLLTAGEQSAGRGRQLAVWSGVAAVVALGCVVPLIWIPASAEMYRRATTKLAARATAYYAPSVEGPAVGPRAARRWVLRPGAAMVALRTAVSILLIVGVLVTALVADLRIASSHVLAVVVLLTAVSALYVLVLRARRRGPD